MTQSEHPCPLSKRLGLALLGGVVLGLTFPDHRLSLLSWVALIPLFIALHRASIRDGGLAGLLFGFGWFGLTLTWVQNSMIDFGGISLWMAIPINGLLVAILSLYPALFASLYAATLRVFGLNRALMMAPFFWLALDYLRGHCGFASFPWVRLADAQYQTIPLIQMADQLGAEGIDYLIVAVNAGLFGLGLWRMTLPDKRGRFPWGATLAPIVLLAHSLGYGYAHMSQPPPSGSEVAVALIQGNIDQARKWERKYRLEQLRLYAGLTRQAAKEGAALVVWPETAAPFYFGKGSSLDNTMTRLSAELNIPLIFGAPGLELNDTSRKAYNRAWVIRPDGGADHYDKLHLVPFGEYVPMRNLLFFVDKLTTDIGSMTPGDHMRTLDVGPFRVATLICFEGVLPDLSREGTRAGAAALVTITNDSWFGRSALSEQMLASLVFRAVENRRPLLRAAQSGVSAIIDATGRITARTTLFKETILHGSIHPAGREMTLYTRIGPVLAYVALLLSGVTLIFLGRWR